MEEENKQEQIVEEVSADQPTEKSAEDIAAEYLAGWQRAKADYQNLKKEADAKSREWFERGADDAAEKLIPLAGYFQSAIDSIPPDQKEIPWVKGVAFIKSRLDEALKELGLEKIETVGMAFNTTWHEAVGEEETGEGESGIIIKEVSPGFKRGERVIQPAKVIVKK